MAEKRNERIKTQYWRFDRFVVAMDIKDRTRKRSLLLYLAGSDVEKIFETIPDNGEEKDYDVAATKLTEYFARKKPIEDFTERQFNITLFY